MTPYGTANYTQTFTSEKAELERQQRQEIADLFRDLEGMQALIRVKLEILVRGGATADLLKDIAAAAEDYGDAFNRIMALGSLRLAAPTKNRY
jgi:hypothetical protein